MVKPIDLTGRRFGKLLAIEFTGESRKNQGRMWRCSCDCGGVAEVSVGVLNSGAVNSCGCIRVEKGRALGMTTFKHGEGHSRKTKEYKAWSGIKERCLYEKHPNYLQYGGRGISICERWRVSYLAFLEDMGRAEAGQSIDRIDVNGNYTKENCRWTNDKVQRRNKTNTKYMLINGVKRKAIEVAEEIGVHRNDIYIFDRVKKLLEKKYGLD